MSLHDGLDLYGWYFGLFCLVCSLRMGGGEVSVVMMVFIGIVVIVLVIYLFVSVLRPEFF